MEQDDSSSKKGETEDALNNKQGCYLIAFKQNLPFRHIMLHTIMMNFGYLQTTSRSRCE